jgi:hypothetical protein
MTSTRDTPGVQHVETALDHLVAAHAELVKAQAVNVETPIADMLAGVNEALAAHLVAELRKKNT